MRQKTVAQSLFVKERPQQREQIIRENLIPDVVFSRGRYFWDGWSARRPDGRRIILPDACAAQMLVMAKSGFWGDLSAVVLDWNAHAVIRETLDRKIARSLPDVKEWEPAGRESEKARGASA
jgi:hypothetical protein